MANLLRSTIVFVFLMLGSWSWGQTLNSDAFPEAFYGTYKGVMEYGAQGKVMQIPMTFQLKGTDAEGRYEYTIVYGAGDTAQPRNYTLIAVDASKGVYRVDENNGIVLDALVRGHQMFSTFEVQGSLLTTHLSFYDDHMMFEITMARKEKAVTTKTTDAEAIEVISYPISSLQITRLEKQ